MFIIDRFEDGFAVVEGKDGETMLIAYDLLSPNAREGDILVPDGEDRWRTDEELTKQRRQQIRRKLENLWEE